MRREDLEGLMQSFAERIENSFEKAAARARDIGAFLAEIVTSTGGMIDRQFAGIRANIEQERESTAAAMRAACEQANAELAGIFGQTTERFQSAAAELRHMSREIQHELEVTREALRRGAADSPQETAQQAAAMRRAVADQIKALEALTEIVIRSGRAYDVSQPAPVNVERIAQPVPPRRVEPARAAEPSLAPEPPRPEAQRPRSDARPANAKTSERGGWISDLLARADSEEPPVSSAAPAKPTQPAQRLIANATRPREILGHLTPAEYATRFRDRP